MQAFLNLINTNKGIDYNAVGYCVFGYILILWILICVWVAKDASERYKSSFAGILWAVTILLLNFPVLMLYFLFRPENHHSEANLVQSGVNVPLINFIGKDNQVALAIELKINSQNLTEAVKDLKISLDWEESEKIKIIDPQTGDNENELKIAEEQPVSFIKSAQAKLNNYREEQSKRKQVAQLKSEKNAQERAEQAENLRLKKQKEKLEQEEQAKQKIAVKREQEEANRLTQEKEREKQKLDEAKQRSEAEEKAKAVTIEELKLKEQLKNGSNEVNNLLIEKDSAKTEPQKMLVDNNISTNLSTDNLHTTASEVKVGNVDN